MSESRRRLLEDAPELEPSLRAALQYARADLPSDAMLARLTSRALAEVAPSVSAVAQTRGVLRLANFCALASLVLAGGVLWLTKPRPAPGPVHAPSVVEPPVRELPRMVGDTHEGVAAQPAPSVPPPASKKRAASRPALVSSAKGDQELELLLRARRLVSAAPARALVLLEEHRALHQRGDFREEREALAIEALWRLDRRAEATRRLAVFETTYPRSAYLARSRQLVRDAGAP